MIYKSAAEWRNAPQKKIALFAMSGLGKTYISSMLRETGSWFHYSVDYRIGTRYMGEHIADNAKAEAMKVPFLRELLLTDSIYIASNISFENLSPLSTYLGKPGSEDKGGLPFESYMQRQDQHREAEIAALLETPHFLNRAKSLYGYEHFVCDTGGSICEVVDPSDENDPILNALSKNTLMIWIKGSEAHTDELVRRFDASPKPMYYKPEFLMARWNEYLEINNCAEADVDPDTFVRWIYAQALAHRQPRYEAMSKWGITLDAKDVVKVKSAGDFEELIANTLEQSA